MDEKDATRQFWELCAKYRGRFTFDELFYEFLRLYLYKYLSNSNNHTGYVIAGRYSFKDLLDLNNSYQLELDDVISAYRLTSEKRDGSRIAEIICDVYRDAPFLLSQPKKDRIVNDLTSFVDKIIKIDLKKLYYHSCKNMGKASYELASESLCRVMGALCSEIGVSNLFMDQFADSVMLPIEVLEKTSPKKCVLQVKNERSYKMLACMLILNEVSFKDLDILNNDSFENPYKTKDKYELQVSYPPFGIRTRNLERSLNDPRFSDMYPSSIADVFFIKQIMYQMSEGGSALIVVPARFLMSSNKAEKRLRQILVDSGVLKGIISLPAKLLYGTSIPSYVLYLQKGRKLGKIRFYDAKSLFSEDRRGSEISESNATKLAKTFFGVADLKNNNILEESYHEIVHNDYDLYIDRYLADARLGKAFKSSGFKCLENVAEVLTAKKTTFEGKTIEQYEDFRYPLHLPVKDSAATSIRIKKGDIIYNKKSKNFYLVDDDVLEAVFAPSNSLVIRPRNIQPEYLLLYLNTDDFRKAVLEITPGIVLMTVKGDFLKKALIPMPTKEPEEYRKIFDITYKYGLDYERLSQYLEDKKEHLGESSGVDSIIDQELVSKAFKYLNSAFKKDLDKDMEELSICYSGGAYKAAVILAGSILEAVLLEWVGEIDNIDYSRNGYFIEDDRGRRRRAGLVDLIHRIDDIYQPDWIEEASKATEIRRSRNTVHATVSRGRYTDKETCKKIIDYLQDILQSKVSRI